MCLHAAPAWARLILELLDRFIVDRARLDMIEVIEGSGSYGSREIKPPRDVLRIELG